MRIYLSGPMRGYANFNRAAFNSWADVLRSKGHGVFNPIENSERIFGAKVYDNPDGDEGAIGSGDSLAISRLMFRIDLSWICENADAVAMLPGWEKSRGAVAERAAALALPIPVFLVEEL